MKMFRAAFLGLASGATMLLSTSAWAGGDLAPERPRSWSGCYIGLQGGYSWANVDGVDTTLAGTNPAAYDYTANGIVAGGHLGCAMQTGALVFGVEGDVEVADLDGDSVAPAPINTYFHRTDINWMGSARLRAGITSGQALFYVTGGWAWAGVDHKFGFAPGTTFFHPYSETRDGWTLGGGVESMLKPGVSVRIEYRYSDFGSVTNTNAGQNSVDRNDLTSHAVRVGLSARF